ncbi:MAG: LeuA family protein [Acidobacteriia bacterium]|nr:LeuA family protein [Terriglobia bacterium]
MDEKLIYDWNTANGGTPITNRRVLLNDESLRDGLQSPSVRDPSIEEKIEILHLMNEVGIDSLDLGLPGAGPRARADVERLAREIVQGKLTISANCAARTIEADITPIAEVVQRTGLEIEAATFIGSSPIRRYTEEWTVDHLVRTTERAVRYAVNLGLPVMYVTEDTTRADPETVKLLYSTAIRCGARAICVCDTVGHATPAGVRSLIHFVIDEVVKPGGATVRVDWHGHSDRGLAIPNCLAAVEAGADQIHGCALGIGERVGNASMDQLLVNLKLMGIIHQDLSKLKLYCQAVSRATRVPIPVNYPVFGADAFRTATGVHAAAVIKAFRKKDEPLANSVYSGVPAHLFGLEQVIEIGPMSGKSNIIYWLERHGMSPSEPLVDAIYTLAKQANHVLSDSEIRAVIRPS